MIRGALILGGAGAVCKVLGMVYRILLGNILGTQGMGNLQLAYSVYSMLLVAASGGMPAALSAVVARRFAKADPQGAFGIFTGIAENDGNFGLRRLAFCSMHSAVYWPDGWGWKR